jgi:hypothetical protein
MRDGLATRDWPTPASNDGCIFNVRPKEPTSNAAYAAGRQIIRLHRTGVDCDNRHFDVVVRLPFVCVVTAKQMPADRQFVGSNARKPSSPRENTVSARGVRSINVQRRYANSISEGRS